MVKVNCEFGRATQQRFDVVTVSGDEDEADISHPYLLRAFLAVAGVGASPPARAIAGCHEYA